MSQYWITTPQFLHGIPLRTYGCFIFQKGRDHALAQALGDTQEQARAAALRIVSAMVAVEQGSNTAQAARHFLMRHGEPQLAEPEDMREYDAYVDTCEKNNQAFLPFDRWCEKQDNGRR